MLIGLADEHSWYRAPPLPALSLRSAPMLLAHDDDHTAETFCAWRQVVQTIFSRL